MATKVLNLYAGIGGNRKLWEDVDVTAVEWDEQRADIYRELHPNDTVIVADAHEYLVDNLQDADYDFIWSSPPCPTHSQAKHRGKATGVNNLEYPDMDLYAEIILLKNYADCEWVVENTEAYYQPLIEPLRMANHYFWSSFHIPKKSFSRDRGHYESIDALEEKVGFDLSCFDIPKYEKKKVLRNCVQSEVGNYIFKQRNAQETLV
jgi:DNA (cytosine-5)-methyltransferase 1